MPAPPLPPLRHRLPNPPPVFVGRQSEIATLARLVRRAPVTLVTGFGGIGKTALVLATLHRRMRADAQRAVLVRVGEAAPKAGGAEALHSALGRALGAEDGWAPDDERTARVIDLAEQAGSWVVLEDLHAGDPEVAAGLMGALSRYARRARWIATTREALATVPSAQQIVLEGLRPADLEALARALAPRADREARLRAVTAAAGSPWRLQEELAGRSGGAARPLDHLSPGSRALLARLTLVELPLETPVLSALGASQGALSALARGGFLERTAGGVQLHAVAREAIAAEAPTSQARAVAEALAATREPDLALEGARLLIKAGDRRAAAEIVAASGAASIDAGLARRLWDCLDRLPDAGLEALRLRCAVELGRPDAAALADPPPAADREARLWWALAQFQMGRVAEASVAAASVAEAGALADDLAFEGALLHGRCLGTMGRFSEALLVLAPLAASPDPARRDRAEAHRARWLLHLDAPAARLLAQRLVRRLDALPASAAREIAERAAGIFVFLGRLREAAAALPELAELGPDLGSSDLHFDREVLLWRLAVLTYRGAGEAARALGAGIRARPDATPSQRQYAELLALPLAIAAGQLDDVGASIDRLAADAARCGHAQIYYFAEIYRIKVALLRGTRRLPDSWEASVPAPSGLERLHLQLLRTQHARRWGARGDGPPLPAPDGEVVSVDVARAIAAAELAAIDGDTGAASADAAHACALSATHDQHLMGAEALQVRCEVALAAGAADALVSATAALEAAAVSLALPRFAAEARFFGAVAAAFGPGGLDAGVLEACAAAGSMAPVAARRARALLAGSEVLDGLDALDRVVIAGAQRTGGARFETVRGLPPADVRSGDESWRSGWGIDGTRRAVWLPDGRWVDLTAAPLGVKLLEALADHGGAASKELLTTTVWGEREYHPLRHDKRLQVAVLRLRRLIETEPRRPARLVTTEDGYTLGAAEPIRRLRGPVS